jgi:hypothetical protein
MMRPYLPMLRKFLDQGGMEKLREMEGLTPEQREEALRRMMEGESAPAPSPAPQAKPQERYSPRPDMGGSDLERRLADMEQRMARMEALLRESLGARGGDRGAERRERRGDRLFGRLGDTGRRMKVWRDGLRKLRDLTTPDDIELLRDTLQQMDLRPDDLQQPDDLMQKLQNGAEPATMIRFMEIFSRFIATPEGRAFVDELEQTVARLEAFVNSPEGKRLSEALQQLQSRRGSGEGGANGLMKRLEDLIQGRDKRDRGGDDHRQARPRRQHSSTPQQSEGTQPPAGSKLY